VQALPAEEALHAVCTVRGRTGAVVAIQPVHTESAEELANVLRRSLTDAQRAQVEFVAVDDVSHRLHAELLNVLPNMKGLVLDTMHLCMKYEQEPAP
jgi:methionine synthase II (cobalamin-independent)